MSTALVPPAEGTRACKSVSPAGSAENAACVTLCAAPGISAKMEYVCLLSKLISEGKLRKPSLKALVMIIAPWMGILEELHCLQKCITPKDKKVLSVSGRQTAPQDCVVLDTSGPRYVNLSSKKVKCVPSTGEKAPMGWKYSNAVTAEKVCLAGIRKTTIKPVILLGFTLVRDTKPAIQVQWTPFI